MFDFKIPFADWLIVKYFPSGKDRPTKKYPSLLHTPYKPTDEQFRGYPSSYQPDEQGTHLIVAWPLSYGVAWRIKDDARNDIGCSARFFSLADAQLFQAAKIMSDGPDSKFHYQVVKLDDDK